MSKDAYGLYAAPIAQGFSGIAYGGGLRLGRRFDHDTLHSRRGLSIKPSIGRRGCDYLADGWNRLDGYKKDAALAVIGLGLSRVPYVGPIFSVGMRISGVLRHSGGYSRLANRFQKNFGTVQEGKTANFARSHFGEQAGAVNRLTRQETSEIGMLNRANGEGCTTHSAPSGVKDTTGLGSPKLRRSDVSVGEYSYDSSSGRHFNSIVESGKNSGRLERPYMRSLQVIEEIQAAGQSIPDPRGIPGVVRWDISGSVNGTEGTWELVMNPDLKRIYHFLFNSR